MDANKHRRNRNRGGRIMSEAMFDLLFIIDSVITDVLKLVIIVLILKLIIYRRKYLKEMKCIK